MSTLGAVSENHDKRRVPISRRDRRTRSGPYPYWGANGILDHIDDYIFEGPHVLLAEDGTVARDDGCAVVHWVEDRFWVNNHAHVLSATGDVNQRWLYYALRNVRIAPFLTGSVQLKLTQKNLRRIPLAVPTRDDQERIAFVLGSLDEKIAHNRWLAHLLEEIAGLHFDEKFVRFTGHRDLVDSELGLIPRGWETRCIGDIATLQNKPMNPQDSPKQPLEHFSFAAFDAGRQPEETIGRMLKSAKLLIDDQCILISKLNPTRQRVWWPIPTGTGTPVCSTEFVVLKPKGDFPQAFLYGLARFHRGVTKHIAAHATGTTGSRQRVRPADVLNAKFAIPPRAPLEQAAEFMGQVCAAAEQALIEIRTLNRIRDLLLPRLISGGRTMRRGAR